VWLRRHHAAHHDPRLMTRYNFNVTFPIADRLFGTVAPAAADGAAAAVAPARERLRPGA